MTSTDAPQPRNEKSESTSAAAGARRAADQGDVSDHGHFVLAVEIERLDAYERLYGSELAERLLEHVAVQIAGHLRATDIVVDREGHGPLVLLAGGTSHHDASAVASRLARAIGDPCLVDGRSLHVIAHVDVTEPHGDGLRLEVPEDFATHLP